RRKTNGVITARSKLPAFRGEGRRVVLFYNVRFWHNDDFSFGSFYRALSFFAVGAFFYSDEPTDRPGRKISGVLHPDMTNNSISVYQKCPTPRPRSPRPRARRRGL